MLISFSEEDRKNLEEIRSLLTEGELNKVSEEFATFLKEKLGVSVDNLEGEIFEYLKNSLNCKADYSLAEEVYKSGVDIPEFIASYGKLFELIREVLKPKVEPERLNELCLSLAKHTLLDIASVADYIIEEHFETFIRFFEENPDPILIIDENFKIFYANNTFSEILKIDKPKGMKLKELFPERYLSHYELLCKACREKISGSFDRVVYLTNRKLGITKPFKLSFEHVKLKNKDYIILDLRDAEEELKREKERENLSILYGLISELYKVLLEETNLNRLFFKMVDAFVRKGIYTYAAVIRTDKEVKVAEEGIPTDYSVCIPFYREYALVLTKNEPFYNTEVDLIRNFLSELSDIIQSFSLEGKLKELRFYDPVTELPTRAFFVSALSDMIREADKKGERVGLIVLDIDNFTAINGLYGQQTGDRVLKEVADGLKEIVRLEDILARIGADTYAIAFVSKDPFEAANSLITRIRTKFIKPIKVDGHSIPITFSMGVAFYPDDAKDGEQLIAHATQAMFEARKLGGDTVIFYHRDTKRDIEKMFILRNELQKALKEKEFVLFYQPKVNLKKGKIEGAEALIRWVRKGKLVPPYEFIPILEESGLITEVGLWVLEEAIKQISQWKSKGINIEIAVNLSAVQLRSVKHLEIIIKTLQENYDAVPYLGFEITETALIENISTASVFLKLVSELGVKVYIDDFGTGYSSIAYLKTLPVYALKIDVEFIRNIDKDEKDYEIVKTIINLAKNLNLKTVAEGIETKEHEKILKELGCDYGQGYYYSPPVPPEKFEELYRKFAK